MSVLRAEPLVAVARPRRPRKAASERVLVAVAAGAAVLTLVGTGALRGWPLLLLIALGLLALPLARDLSTRVLLLGCLVAGWLPLAWWVPWSLPVGRVAVGAAGLAAGLAAAVAGGPGRRRRARGLLPGVRPADALLLVVGAVAAALRTPWWGARTADAALALVTGGWDHSAHFDITAMIRRHGQVMHWLGADPLGDTWSYTRYPQGFHALTASVVEAMLGPRMLDPQSELLTYVRVLGVLDVGGAVVLASAVLALPWLRARGWLATPAVALVAASTLAGPGAHLLQDGFPAFGLGAALLVGLVPLVVTATRVPDPRRLAAVGGALVGIAHTWALLLALALPVVLLLLVPWRAERWRATRREWLAASAVVAATGAAVLTAVGMLARQSLGEMLVIGGAITPPRLRWVALLFGAAALACALLMLTARRTRSTAGADAAADHDERVRIAGLGAPLLVAGALAAVVAAVQLRSTGLGYYFWKLLIADALFATAVAVIGWAALAAERVRLPVSRRVVALSAVLAILLTMVYGPSVPRALMSQVVAAAPGQLRLDTDPPPSAERLWSAVATSAAPGARHVVVLGGDSSPTDRIRDGQWYNALTGRWTDQANELLFDVMRPVATGADLAALATTVLADSGTVLLVPPDLVAPARDAYASLALGDASLDPAAADRIVGW